jgi:hypothetical protein
MQRLAPGIPALILIAVLGASSPSRADVITPKKGAPFKGTVVAIDEKSVTVKTESETRVIERSSLRRIEFGDAAVTGIQGREYANAEYGLRLSIPDRWSPGQGGGGDFAARRGPCSFLVKGLPGGDESNSETMIKGAIAGMKTSVSGSEFGPLEDSSFSGIAFRSTSLKAPNAGGKVFFHVRQPYIVMILVLSDDPAKPQASCLADWDGKIRFVEE